MQIFIFIKIVANPYAITKTEKFFYKRSFKKAQKKDTNEKIQKFMISVIVEFKGVYEI